jgi:Transglycosylase SLT domain
MGSFDQGAGGAGKQPARWRRLPRPSSAGRKRLAALGVVALLCAGFRSGIPLVAGRFPGMATAAAARVLDRAASARPGGLGQPAAPGTAVAGAALPIEHGGGGQVASGRSAGHSRPTTSQTSAFRQIILPDLLIVAPSGLTARQIRRLRAIRGVRDMITFDGAQITAGGRSVSVIGVNPDTFRSWVPLRTASDPAFWADLTKGEFVASTSAASSLGLRPGAQYQLTGASSQVLTYATSAKLGMAGVDLLVSQETSRKLGLIRRVAGLISAPADSIAVLTHKVSAILGRGGRIEVLRSQQLPVSSVSASTKPTTYLALFKSSAALYCPGLSWTVLAAIGQIESADGTNMGPSTAGAMGPMQFLPSTWALWGIDGFGDTGPPDIMNPYDAVPSAARLLCADGAAAGGTSLYHAIFDYNHADWYVNEVLSLAAEYAADYN